MKEREGAAGETGRGAGCSGDAPIGELTLAGAVAAGAGEVGTGGAAGALVGNESLPPAFVAFSSNILFP